MSLQAQLESLKEATLVKITAAQDLNELNQIRVETLGKKGPITEVLRGMKDLSPEERPKVGSFANEIRDLLTEEIERKKQVLEEEALNAALAKETIDVTLPGRKVKHGTRHIVTQIMEEIEDIFVGMGFEILDGYEIEESEYNFTKLNTSEGHPARDWSDTFYITNDSSILLRTQTSPMQVHAMEAKRPPIRVVAPGRVYRKDEVDATHSPMFHQIEGLVVDEGITMGDLKGALETLIKRLYGEDAVVRFRPHHFPFTEPSCEVDMQCFKCRGTGEVAGQVCSTCHGEGWIELLGAGMVHPKVLEGCGIDSKKYSGFAFGIGLERMAMGRLRFNDLRLIFDNDIRFLSQF